MSKSHPDFQGEQMEQNFATYTGSFIIATVRSDRTGLFGLVVSVWAVLVTAHFGLVTFQSHHFCT